MTELSVERDYRLDKDKIGQALDLPSTDIENYFLSKPMALRDSRLAIGATVYLRTRTADRDRSKDILLHLVDGQVRCRDLSFVLTANPRGKFHDMNWSPVALEAGVLYVQNTEQAVLIPHDGSSPPVGFNVRNPIPDVRLNEQVTTLLRPSRSAHLVANGRTVAMPLATGHASEFLAFLSVDIEKREVIWDTWIAGDARASLLSRWFGRPRSAGVPRSEVQLVKLSASDFPHWRGRQQSQPLVNQALLRGNRVLVYTKGHSDSPKYGYPCGGIAEVGPDGRVKSTPFMENFADVRDEKKRGIEGRFTSDGCCCILSPIYESTDPWFGRQKLFDLETQEMRTAEMPRSLHKFRVVDQFGDCVWAELAEPEATRFVALRMAR